MTPERETEIERICQAALECEVAERTDFLSEACAGDSDLRRQVEALLAHVTAAEQFIETPAVEVVARRVAAAGPAMSLGTRIGPYEVLAPLGAGGMGEVYRARDSQLGREVALKLLPPLFARDPDRLARFEREARVLAALSHPNIAAIYAVEPIDQSRALVLEFVAGPTLADRLRKGPLPLTEALAAARQIAEALEAAHENGIVHRDLKPANIKLTPEGVVKVLDFGLAKIAEAGRAGGPVGAGRAREAEGGGVEEADLTHSPTFSRGTKEGVILGTAAYMSPEQARGQVVDKRTDIWAFGCVLYEMLTGTAPFGGLTVTDTLAAIIEREPEWSALPTQTPIPIGRLLRRCLDKDSKRRLRDIGEARIEIEESRTPRADDHTPRPRTYAPAWGWALVAIMAFVAGAVSLIRSGQPAPAAETVRLQIPIPENVRGEVANFALSPDGRRLAFFAAGSDGVMRLWVRAIDSLETQALQGSEVAGGQTPFFWSYDSRFIVFGAGAQLRKIDASGGPVQAICDLSNLVVGGSWNSEGDVIFGSALGGIMRVSAAGGNAVPLTVPDSSRGERSHVFPVFLPDGRRFLYLRVSSTPENSGIYIGSLDAKPEEQNFRRLLATSFGPAYVWPAPSGPNRLLFVRDRTLLSQPFDTSRLELVGDTVPVAEHLVTALNFGSFSVSRNGHLAYKTGRLQEYQLTWLDRQGKTLGLVGEPKDYLSVTLSPDGTRAVVVREDPLTEQRYGMWLVDLARGTSLRLTFRPPENSPVWFPDGSRLAFSHDGDLYQKPVNSPMSEELLFKSDENGFPASWSQDGRFLLFGVAAAKTKMDLFVLPMDGTRTPAPVVRTEANDGRLQGAGPEGLGRFSPDGRWIVYLSDESGRFEAYVRSFVPDASLRPARTEQRWLISKGASGGINWRRDGKELTYVDAAARMMSVDVVTTPAFSFGEPKSLFTLPPGVRALDQTADGQRWLVAAPVALSSPTPLTVVLNWQSSVNGP